MNSGKVIFLLVSVSYFCPPSKLPFMDRYAYLEIFNKIFD